MTHWHLELLVQYVLGLENCAHQFHGRPVQATRNPPLVKCSELNNMRFTSTFLQSILWRQSTLQCEYRSLHSRRIIIDLVWDWGLWTNEGCNCRLCSSRFRWSHFFLGLLGALNWRGSRRDADGGGRAGTRAHFKLRSVSVISIDH
jgi:hypothetical protein